MKYSALIIDDEPPARHIIHDYLRGHEEIEIAGEFSDGFSGLKAIQELKPDLVFLDIQMPKLTGFELLDLIENPPVIIFSTAYDQFAIKAFEIHAVDYLLKPYAKERFDQAVGKALEFLSSSSRTGQPIRNILRAVDEQPEYLSRIAVKIHHKVHVIPVHEIQYIQADGDYVTIYTKHEKYLKEKTMQYFESHLNPAQFVRIHRSAIIHVDYIDKIEYYDKESHVVLMKNGASLRASSAGYKALRETLKL
ncbi:MAG: LytTR family transcriptional regulator DNA-binding domain-containing protein [bacterium]